MVPNSSRLDNNGNVGYEDDIKPFMKYYFIEPEVAGGWGEHTIADTSVHPQVVSKLHYEFDGWLGDVLLTSFPVFIITESAKEKLTAMGATGIEFDRVEISTSQQYKDFYPNRTLPKFVWLKITGRAGQDDFGIAPAPDLRLVISESALNALEPLGISHAEIEAFVKTRAV